MSDADYDQSGHSDTESVANDLSDLYVYIYRINNSNSVLVPDNMSICTKVNFLLQLLTRQSTWRAQTFLAKANLAQGPFKKKMFLQLQYKCTNWRN